MERTSCEEARFQAKNNFKVSLEKKMVRRVRHLCSSPHRSNGGSAIFNLTEVKSVFPGFPVAKV